MSLEDRQAAIRRLIPNASPDVVAFAAARDEAIERDRLSPDWIALAASYLHRPADEIDADTIREQGKRILKDCAQWISPEDLMALEIELAAL